MNSPSPFPTIFLPLLFGAFLLSFLTATSVTVRASDHKDLNGFFPLHVPDTLEALKVYDIGISLIAEEILPMSCPVEELDRFIEESREMADDWIAHYFGVMPGTREPESIAEAAREKGVEYWRDKATSLRKP